MRARLTTIPPSCKKERLQLPRNMVSDFQKFFLTAYPTHWHIHRVSSLHEGRIAIVTDVGWDVVDADVAL